MLLEIKVQQKFAIGCPKDMGEPNSARLDSVDQIADELQRKADAMPTEADARTKSILDPIHGLVRLTEREMKLVDHPLFQRLRHIKQNGLLYMVFPSATHTRFEHSIGVLYVAQGMLNSLTLNSRVGLEKGTVVELGDARLGQAVAFPKPNTPERTFVSEITRLAALAHDMGHGPLSHTFDSFAPSRALLQSILDSPDLEALRPLSDFILRWGTNEKNDKKIRRVPHEVMSCVFFTKAWKDIGGEPRIASAVCAAILGEWNGESAAALLDDSLSRAWVPFVHDAVASAPADADRMDYMERDSRSIGVTYGLFDRNRVLKSLLCYSQSDHGKRTYRLGIKHSGLQAIENLMQARYQLYVQVYYHKTNHAISMMLKDIAGLADDHVDLFSGITSLSQLSTAYEPLSDDQFLRILARQTDTQVPPSIVDITQSILKRKLHKRVLDLSTEADAKSILESLRATFPGDADAIVLDESKPKALKDLAQGAALLLRNGEHAYEVVNGLGWRSESAIIAALASADDKAFRIYLKNSESSSARRIREKALALSFSKKAGDHAAS